MKERRLEKNKNINKFIKNCSIGILVCAILLSNTVGVFAETNYEGKEEVVYGVLDGNGSIDEVYVVNIFDKDGEIVDYGQYSSIRNMTTDDNLNQEDDKITVNNTNGKLYYEGELEKNQLPWNIDIKYEIDGKEYDPDQIAGKSGELTIKINISQNKKCDDVFFKNHALQASLTLDTEKAKNIVSEGATMVNVGSKKQLTYTILPGKGADITINTDVTDFEMEAIEINGIYLNLNVDIDDEDLMKKVDELLDGVNDMEDAADKVKNGAEELKDSSDKLTTASQSLNSGSMDLNKGISSLNNGIGQIQNALVELDDKSDDLTSGSAEFKAVLVEIQNRVTSLAIETEKLEALSNGSSNIKKAIEVLSNNMKLLNESVGYSQFEGAMKDNGLNIEELKSANQGTIKLLKGQVEELSKFYNKIKDLPGYEKQASETRVQIEELKKVIEVLKVNNAAIAGNEKYINTVSESISKMDEGLESLKDNYEAFDEAIDSMTKELGNLLINIPKLTDAINRLVMNYSYLDDGINNYTDGVAGVLAGYNNLVYGISDLNNGSMKLEKGNNLFYQNMTKLSNGSLNLYKGTIDLKEGTSKFKDETSNIEDETREQIDDIMKGLTGDTSKIKSFASEKNKGVKMVQFVIKTKDIKKTESSKVSQEPEFKLAFWEKFVNLFQF